jgi:hypothetical protein
MGMLDTLIGKVFGKKASAAPPPPPSSTQTNITAQPASAVSTTPIDVNAVLSEMAKKRSEKLNWQTSIVDLMKLLDMDSSLTARKQLAQELHYTGDFNDSAAMNIWLQQEVLKRFAQNGGKVSPDLLH